jgi:hypothetical protein
MLNKIGGLARALYVVLAIVAAFAALGGMNVPLALVVLGLVAGLAMTREHMVLAAVTVVALPLVGAALGNIPAIGAQLTAVCGNLQLGVAGAFATALAIFLYQTIMGTMTGLTGAGAGTAATATR